MQFIMTQDVSEAAVCVDIVIVITGTCVYGLSEECVCAAACLYHGGVIFVCLHAYASCRHVRCLCTPPLAVFMCPRGERWFQFWMAPSRPPRVFAETCLCAGSRGAEAAAARSQPACTPAMIPRASATSLAAHKSALFHPAPRLLMNLCCFFSLLFTPHVTQIKAISWLLLGENMIKRSHFNNNLIHIMICRFIVNNG